MASIKGIIIACEDRHQALLVVTTPSKITVPVGAGTQLKKLASSWSFKNVARLVNTTPSETNPAMAGANIRKSVLYPNIDAAAIPTSPIPPAIPIMAKTNAREPHLVILVTKSQRTVDVSVPFPYIKSTACIAINTKNIVANFAN